MIKGLKYYEGCTILGYRFSLPRVGLTGSVEEPKKTYIKGLESGKDDTLYRLSKVRKVNYKK